MKEQLKKAIREKMKKARKDIDKKWEFDKPRKLSVRSESSENKIKINK